MQEESQINENTQTLPKPAPLSASNIFVIKTEVFEGPLDLLLTLIEKRKLFINDISLAKVTDEYIQYVNRLGDYSLSDRTQFIYIASTLLLVKAKSLLPSMSLTEEEKTDVADLERRLKELEIMRRASETVQKLFGARFIFPRGGFDGNFKSEMPDLFAPTSDTTLAQITEAIGRVLTSLPKKAPVVPKLAVKKTMSLEDMMVNLSKRIQNAVRMSFREFSGKDKIDKAERVHVIVSFLAMLELVKQGVLDAHQEGLFDEIHMESQNIGVPRYS
ncbi:MAG: segregation and condensation protein [Patescibacteria group bacterium]|jgi:segregation and condensation protein A|nr:segregation and condensation protein [Patescibacteria group bacterium]